MTDDGKNLSNTNGRRSPVMTTKPLFQNGDVSHDVPENNTTSEVSKETPAPKRRRKGSGWGPRKFTAKQWIKRDLRSAQTRAEKDRKSGKRPITLPKL